MVATARAHPHMPRRRKSSSPARASGGSASPRAAPRRVSYCVTTDGWLRALLLGALIARVFFPATARSIVLGWIVEVEFLPNQLCELARSHRLARNELLLDERQRLALKLMRTVRTALSRHQSSNAAFVEAGLGLVVRRPRNAVLLGGGGHRRVLDRDTAQHLVLNLHEVVRIEELVLLKLRIAHLPGSGLMCPLRGGP